MGRGGYWERSNVKVRGGCLGKRIRVLCSSGEVRNHLFGWFFVFFSGDKSEGW